MAQKAAVLPQLPLTEQQSPNVLPRHIAPTVDADPHFPSSETGVHVPKLAWHRLVVPQNGGVLPQLPLVEQQGPNLLPRQVFPFPPAPQRPSVEMARAVEVGALEDDEVEEGMALVELGLELLVAELYVYVYPGMVVV